MRENGRGDWIRTSDLFVPNEARYQAAPRPDPASQPMRNNAQFRDFLNRGPYLRAGPADSARSDRRLGRYTAPS